MHLILPTGRRTTRLGFGCAFSRSVSKSDAARCLDAAFDAGIRHFDVAPSYADGAAEGYLGNFLKRHNADVTVTTKYGILPPIMRPFHVRVARNALSPALRALRRVPAIAGGLAKSASALHISSKAAFNAVQARLSLNRSLEELQLDAVDLFLMHGPDVVDLGDDLLEFLQECIASKRIGAFGIGGDAARAPDMYRQRRPFCDVMQFDWSVFSPKFNYPGTFRIHYWVFSQELRHVHQALADRPDILRRWSAETDLNLADIKTLADVMLKGALSSYPHSIVLFKSSRHDNIIRNVRVAEDAALERNALRFCELIDHQEGVELITGLPN
jgi:diketogulonate reductase-like aldo/keto reductase